MKTLHPLVALGLTVVIGVAILLPLGFVMIPPMVDYPNHLGRCAVLANLANDAALRIMYEPRGVLLPNMAMDAIVVPLSHWVGILLAGKIFCGLQLLAMFSGALALSWVLMRRVTLWSFAPALLVFNHIYTFGFGNYLFGVGLMLWGLAAWIGLRERPLTLRFVVGSVFALLLFFCHLVAMFLFACVVAGFEIARCVDEWRLRSGERESRKELWKSLGKAAVPVAALFLIPVILLLKSPTHSEVSAFNPSSLGDKLDMLIGMLRIDGNRLDAIFSFIVFGVLIVLFMRKAVAIEPRMRYSIGAIAASFLLLPDSFATCGCVDVRIPIVVAFLLAAGSKVVRPESQTWRFGMAILVGAFVLRTAQVTRDWRQSDATSREVISDLSVLPPHAVVFYAADRDAQLFNEKGWGPPLVHLAVAELVRKPIFFPQLFALPTQHPLAIRPELRNLEDFQSQSPHEFDDADDLAGVVRDFHEEADDQDDVPVSLGRDPSFYVFVITPSGKADVGTYPDTEVIVRRPRYALLKITHTEAASEQRWQAALRRSRRPIQDSAVSLAAGKGPKRPRAVLSRLLTTRTTRNSTPSVHFASAR